MKTLLKKQLIISSIFILFLCYLLSYTVLGQVRVIKTFNDEYGRTVTHVQPDDVFKVNITVYGFSEPTDNIIPFDVVILMDKSSSMLGHMGDVDMAASQFIELAMQEKNNVMNGIIQIGVVTFESNAEIVSNLSSDYRNLLELVDGIGANLLGSTNMEDGIRKANSLLANSLNAVKICILLSDGMPTPNTNEQSMNIDQILMREANNIGIRYFTIGTGNNPASGLLLDIANRTSGEYIYEPDYDELQVVLEGLFYKIGRNVVASKVILNEYVNTEVVSIVDNSWFYSDSINDLPREIAYFPSTGRISISIGSLPIHQSRQFSFMVHTNNCLSPNSIEDSVMIYPNNSTIVKYIYAQTPSEAIAFLTPIYCHKPPGLSIKKCYDNVNKNVVISLKSNYIPDPLEDRIIKNIKVFEFPSLQYQYVKSSSDPPLNQFFPCPNYDALIWEITSLKPQELKNLKFKIDFIGYQPRDFNPMIINEYEKKPETMAYVSYIDPIDGETKKHIPQKEKNEPIIETLQNGRPDIFITPSFELSEFNKGFEKNIKDYLDIIAMYGNRIVDGWNTLTQTLEELQIKFEKIFDPEDSPDIWIDTESNGWVLDWEPTTDPEILEQIKSNIDNVVLDELYNPYFRGIRYQGDIFHINSKNRIYIKIHNTGSEVNQEIQNSIILKARIIYPKNTHFLQSNDWVTLNSITLPQVEEHSSKLIYTELKPLNEINRLSRLNDGIFSPLQISDDDILLMELKVIIGYNEIEKHTNNNETTEIIILKK